MSLADALRGFDASSLLRHPSRRRLPLLAKARDEVEAIFGRPETVSSAGVADAMALILAAHTSGDWTGIGARELRLCSQVALSPDYPIAGSETLLRAFLDHLSAQGGRSAFGGLIRSYLSSFDPQGATTGTAAAFLRTHRHRLPQRWRALPPAVDLLDPSKGPTQLGQVLSQSEQPLKALKDFQLTGPLRAGEFAEQAFDRVCLNLRDVIRIGDGSAMFERFRAVAMDGKTPVYPRKLSSVAAALLSPWRTREPGVELRNKIKELLLQGFGDPRFARQRWASVDEDDRAVLLHWIAEDSLEFFLNVAERHANHMWPARRKFWSAYIAKRAVSNVWIVFGANAAREARRRMNSGEASPSADFGLLQGAQVNDRSVLLMSIDRLTIAEWSHNGRVRMWRPGNAMAPKFFLSKSNPYPADDLRRGADFQQVHHPDRSWQVRVASEIERQTGVSVSPNEYM